MPSRQTTRSGLLSDVARHLILPSGIVSTGWRAVREKAAQVGIEYDEWQDGLGRAILAKRKDGQYAAGIGGVFISICRQVGKTFTIGSMIVMLCILFPNLKVLWTAHRTRTASETFKSLQGIVGRKSIAPFVAAIRRTNGEQEIEFTNGSRIMFGARESGFGRGFDDVDVLVFDECQILTEKALDDMIPATNAAANALVLYMGTPPKPTDQAEVFKARRREALSGAAEDMVFVEVSADPDADSEDRGQWRKANPSYPHRTPESSILRMKRQLGDESFRREGMGIWDDDMPGSRLISKREWDATGVLEPPADGLRSFGVAFSRDGSRLALAGCVKHTGGLHVELVDHFEGDVDDGIAALADWLAERKDVTAQIVMAGAAGSPVLYQALRDRGVPKPVLVVASTAQYQTGNAMFHDGIKDESITHLLIDGQSRLDASVAVCDKKAARNGGWGWSATTHDGDETPLEAGSAAVYGARTSKRKPGRRAEVIL